MDSTASMAQTRTTPGTRRAEHPFKPLALPALAAAVHASTRQPRRAEVERDLPAFLRKEALLG